MSSGLWLPLQEPSTRLGRHRALAPLAGVHVSPIQLGAMSIGNKWAEIGFGAMDRESSFKLLDAQDGSSEEFLGEWMQERGNREQIVLVTKYTANYMRGHVHFVGNNLKSLHNSVAASLKKLRTDYIDILYVHWWDYTCSVEEVMNGLHHLVAQGKVLYLGVSDTPAWVVAKANTYARMANKTPFVIYQGQWSIMHRDFERDVLPMALAEGMALAPWGVVESGKIRTDAEEQKRIESSEGGRAIFGDWKRTEDERKVCLALEKVAKEIGAKNITSVAIAWVMQKAPYVFPIIGGRKIEHLHDNLEALEISLSPEQIKTLDDIVPFDKGFPFTYFGDGSSYPEVFKTAGHFEKWPVQEAIRPTKQ
ncbi:hypothetical protein PHLGIDRAFT_115124 [Phlebiopsis gigantea 11061_1 CR5-6]|uniref:NADP-dependent oxidoreductase domain-containing protein n=1 Tax=Phlebiopsis gigantea (strain 11061_1 CR5-6) TaxID=745531 RepID=A0A0C3SER0_PHLG1|nr:hypothetical protein PHLGIDRAFT_115124 [Phlebiopsis gigantea 11061_1 CR5-6]